MYVLGALSLSTGVTESQTRMRAPVVPTLSRTSSERAKSYLKRSMLVQVRQWCSRRS